MHTITLIFSLKRYAFICLVIIQGYNMPLTGHFDVIKQ